MKRLGNLFERLCDFRTLEAAFARVRKGKARRSDVAAFARGMPENLNAVADELRAGTFRFGNYHFFKVYDPKERLIAAAPVRERIVHHAVIALIGERLERALIDKSYACRKGKGQWKAVAEAERLARLHPWYLKLDIHHYFDSIDHGILKGILRRKIKDARFLALLDSLIDTYRAGETAERATGLPIGNLTSQYFANLYLDAFDRWLDGQDVAHLRYMDDVLVFGTREALRRVFAAVPSFLAAALRLTLKAKGGLHRTARGVDFLGCRILPGGARLNARSRRRFLRKLALYDGLAAERGERWLQNRLTALFAFARQVHSYGFRRKAVGENGQGNGECSSRRWLWQQQRVCPALPLGVSVQQQSLQPQQQQRLLRLPVAGSSRSSVQEAHQNRPFSRSGRQLGQIVHSPGPALVGRSPKTTGGAVLIQGETASAERGLFVER